MKRAKGFTIVEIAVVIVIIATLTGLVLATYARTQADARNKRRENDVKVLKAAVQGYYRDNNAFPQPSSCSTGCDTSTLSGSLVPTYIAAVPSAPSGASYQYITDSTNQKYAILVTREYDTICKTGSNMDSTWFSSAPECPF